MLKPGVSTNPLLFSLFLMALMSCVTLAQAAPLSDEEIADLSLQMFVVQGPAKAPIVEQLASTKDKGLIPTFVLAMRWTGSNVHVAKALSDLTGEKISTWHEAYNWQEQHPEITPHSSYRDLKLRFLGNTDSRFLDLFAPPHGERENMLIRLEEIVWGGALFDDIPSLDRALMIDADEADYLLDTDLVFGVEINGDVRAYPLRIMGWHEMVNDVVGGVPVALAYCTLCGTGILFDTRVEGREKPLVFGSSGLLYRSNKLMVDRETHSLWNQFSGEPVVGPLVSQELKLKILPIAITSWEAWRELHPTTTVLSLNTGHIRNYDSGFIYRDYFASPDLMFPAVVEDERLLARKDYVFGIRSFATSRAWPLTVFNEQPVINDQVGDKYLVLVGDPATRTVRAFEREADEAFEPGSDGQLQTGTGVSDQWELREGYIINTSSKQKRPRVPGHISYWFAWENFMGVKSELYSLPGSTEAPAPTGPVLKIPSFSATPDGYRD